MSRLDYRVIDDKEWKIHCQRYQLQKKKIHIAIAYQHGQNKVSLQVAFPSVSVLFYLCLKIHLILSNLSFYLIFVLKYILFYPIYL